MSEDEKKAVAQRIAHAMEVLPDKNCEYLLGYAECAIALFPSERESA